jgi:hypothetical protein
VIAEGESGGAPELEDFHVSRNFFELAGVDEAVGFGDVRVFERFDDAVSDVDAREVGREFAVRGKIVEGKSNLLGRERSDEKD